MTERREWTNKEAATPAVITDCRWCGAAGVRTMMREWNHLGSVFFHSECEALMRKLGVVQERWIGGDVMSIADMEAARRKLFAERGVAV